MILLIIAGVGIVMYLAWLIGNGAGMTHYLWSAGGTAGRVMVVVLTLLLLAFLLWLFLPSPRAP